MNNKNRRKQRVLTICSLAVTKAGIAIPVILQSTFIRITRLEKMKGKPLLRGIGPPKHDVHQKWKENMGGEYW